MLSIASLIALALVAGFVALAWKWRRECGDVNEDAFCEMQQNASEKCFAPNTSQWCNAVEAVCDGSVLCFDECLKVAALGDRGKAFAKRIRGDDADADTRLHLVDITPSCVRADMLRIMACVRRGALQEEEISWEDSIVKVAAAPIGNGWIIMCIKAERRN
jgi:hypothetical protein